MSDQEKRFTESREHKAFDVQAREKALEKEWQTALPGDRGYRTPYQAPESWAVRSAAIRQEIQGELHTRDKTVAIEVARKASMIEPEKAAAVFKYEHDRAEPKLYKVYTQGKENPDHTRSR